MASPGSSRLVGEGAGQSAIAGDQGALPVYTLLMNAGLTPDDVIEVGDELWRRVKARVAKMALSENPDERVRYLEGSQPWSTPAQIQRGRAFRERKNKEIVAEELLNMQFNRDELGKIDESLRLGLTPTARAGRRTARTHGPNGPEEFEILEEPDEANPGRQVVLRSLTTGRVHRV